MAAPVTYEIGLTLGGIATLLSLGIPDPETEPVDFAASDTLANGLERGLGFQQANWHYGFLLPAQYDALKAFCPSVSAAVVIATMNSDRDFVRYNADMKMPLRYSIRNYKYLDVVIAFTGLVAAE